MNRTTVFAVAMTAILSVSAVSLPAFAAGKLSSESTIAELLDNKEAKAVVDKHLNGLTSDPQIEQARPMTLKALKQFAPNITDEKLAAVDADLAKLK